MYMNVFSDIDSFEKEFKKGEEHLGEWRKKQKSFDLKILNTERYMR